MLPADIFSLNFALRKRLIYRLHDVFLVLQFSKGTLKYNAILIFLFASTVLVCRRIYLITPLPIYSMVVVKKSKRKVVKKCLLSERLHYFSKRTGTLTRPQNQIFSLLALPCKRKQFPIYKNGPYYLSLTNRANFIHSNFFT